MSEEFTYNNSGNTNEPKSSTLDTPVKGAVPIECKLLNLAIQSSRTVCQETAHLCSAPSIRLLDLKILTYRDENFILQETLDGVDILIGKENRRTRRIAFFDRFTVGFEAEQTC